MALRDQPYLPLYVQDYLTDEKLACCTLATQGVYTRILCVFHKSDTYGGILFKQIPKQNFSSSEFFAYILAKQTGVPEPEISLAIEELLFFGVLKICDLEGVPFIYQKRMVADFELSIKRSKAGKGGGGNPALFKQNDKQIPEQTDIQNPENEYEYETGIDNGNTEGKKLQNEYKALQQTKHTIVAFIAAHGPAFCEPYYDLWNIFAGEYKFPKCQTLSPARKKKFAARLKEKAFDFVGVLAKASKSAFIQSSTFFTLDWVLENDKNYIKVLEGNYDNKGQTQEQQKAIVINGNSESEQKKDERAAGLLQRYS